MRTRHLGRCVWLGLAVCLAIIGQAEADGFVLGINGRFVPEREQQAYIEWSRGHERLFVTTRTDAEAGPTLWIIPIPGDPKEIQVEPVKTFPNVITERPIRDAARERLGRTLLGVISIDLLVLIPIAFVILFFRRSIHVGIDIAIMFAIVLFVCVLFIQTLGQKAQDTFSNVGSVVVHQHVEKLGMVVEVLTARSTEALDRYLKAKDLPVTAKNLQSLAPYIGNEFAIICAWSAEGRGEMEAKSLLIEFPSATIFYPLRPSQVYAAEIATTVYVQGWARLAADSGLANFRVDYILGNVADHRPAFVVKGREFDLRDTPITKVAIHSDASVWNEDLQLKPGAPRAVQVAQLIYEQGALLELAGQTLLGAVLGLFLPFAVIRGQHLRLADFGYGLVTGASLGLTLIPAAILFAAWMKQRRPPAFNIDASPKYQHFRNALAWGLGASLIFGLLGFVAPLFFVFTVIALAFTAGPLLVVTSRQLAAYMGDMAIWLLVLRFAHYIAIVVATQWIGSWIMTGT